MMLNNMAKEHMQYHAESGISRFQNDASVFVPYNQHTAGAGLYYHAGRL